MRALVLGAGGLLGREFASEKPREHEIVALAHADLDVRDTAAVQRVIRDLSPNWVINASGFTHVDAAERDRDAAFAVNAAAVGELARVCGENRSGLAHFSTDYVFDGAKTGCYREDDEPLPLSVYGASKLAGEELVRRSGARHLIIRTQWLFGFGNRSFLSTLWQRAQERRPTRVVADQFGCCTFTVDLARVTWVALDRLEGTYHVANKGRVSRFEIAQRIFGAAGVPELVTPCEGADMPAAARRPTNSPLCLSKVERALGYTMAEWTDAMRRYLVALSRGEHAAVRAN